MHWQTVAVATLSVVVILLLRRLRPTWPSFLIAVAIAGAVCAIFHLDVATVTSHFGAVPRSLPAPSLPPFSLEKLQAVLPELRYRASGRDRVVVIGGGGQRCVTRSGSPASSHPWCAPRRA